ncbi:hypothetical protein ANCDUO_18959 [Ancylostoma duodenale]|uniref:Tc1-like transposase DDE domain-containing protein n=1 Tax=Ancylostoma duodenale TaxID=51022 RepID=A0A0C2FWG1_9BILA|nr:hypothetical protein ANCDUO_18959 [Ancylostoma duodenale]
MWNLRYTHVIIALHREGRSVASIHRALQELDPSVSYHQVRKFLQRFYSQQGYGRKLPYRSRSMAPHIERIRRAIEQSYAANSSVTIPAIKRLLQSQQIIVSESHLRFIRNQLGFKRKATKYCQLIRDVNKERRLQFCLDMEASNETFNDCVFTDESTIQADCSVKYCYTRDGDYSSRMRKRAKHPAKLHLWGGISARGATQLAIFPGSVRLDSKKYCQILERLYLPFNRNTYHGYAKLVQDNSPVHKSHYTSQKLTPWGVHVLEWPAESPDLNPIELIWGNMKNYVRRKNVRNLEQLRDVVLEFWRSLTPEICARYVNDISKKMRRVIQAQGGNIYEGR